MIFYKFLFWIIPLQLFTISCRSQFLMIFFLFFYSFFLFIFFLLLLLSSFSLFFSLVTVLSFFLFVSFFFSFFFWQARGPPEARGPRLKPIKPIGWSASGSNSIEAKGGRGRKYAFFHFPPFDLRLTDGRIDGQSQF